MRKTNDPIIWLATYQVGMGKKAIFKKKRNYLVQIKFPEDGGGGGF